MNSTEMYECEICFYQGNLEEFAPKTVSADFSALECPNCLNNDSDSFVEVPTEYKMAA
jgi:hypothetical protein